MTIEQDLYERYTSTSSLVAGVDQDALHRWSAGYFRAHYSRLLPGEKDARILEVGCGYGRYIEIMLAMGFTNCYGIDLSGEQIEYARTVLRLSNVERADALEWLDGKESMYDCILGLDILEHLQTEELISLGLKMHKALKPGGTVIFQVPNAMSPLNPIPYGDLTHVRAFTPQSVRQFLLHVGFVPVGYFEIPPYIHNLQSTIRRILWSGFVKPAISIFVRLVHGSVMGGDIYTSNFIAVAKAKAGVDKNVAAVAVYSEPVE